MMLLLRIAEINAIIIMMFVLFHAQMDVAHGSMFGASIRRSPSSHRQQEDDEDWTAGRRNRRMVLTGTTTFARKRKKASLDDQDRFDVSAYIHTLRNVAIPTKHTVEPSMMKPGNQEAVEESSANKMIIMKKNAPDLRAQLSFSRDGHACIRGLIQPDHVVGLRPLLIDYAKQRELKAWQQKVEVAANNDGTYESQKKAMVLAKSCKTPGECRRVLSKLIGADIPIPFLEFFNCWRDLPYVRDLAEHLAPVAAALLDVKVVRLYKDSIFWKRQMDGPTPWHADAPMAPFDTSLMVTVWIPLQTVKSSGLVFASKSHADYGLLYWQKSKRHKTSENSDLSTRYVDIVDYMPLCLGDVTFHSGWTLHCADGDEDRLALAITYVDANAPIRSDLRDGDDEDARSYLDWVSDVPTGTSNWDHPLAPKLGRKSTSSI